MDLIAKYKEYSDNLDHCDSADLLKHAQNPNYSVVLRKEFWMQRRSYFNTSDSLEQMRAQAKMNWIQQYFGCSIPIRRTIREFLAPNGLFGIFIAPEAVIGSNCVIFQQVTIASDTMPDSPTAGFPTIGSNVFIGPGVTIIGNVIIGNNVRIGANCTIAENIPANSVVSAGASVTVDQRDVVYTRNMTTAQFMENRYPGNVYDYHTDPNAESLVVVRAIPDNLDEIMDLYQGRVNWFRYNRLSQWTRYLERHPREEFANRISSGEYYVIKKDSEIIAGFVISSDSEHWSDETQNAYYMSRNVSKVGYRNLGSLMTDTAKKITLASGKSALRLECVYSNKHLNQIWENQGFMFVRDVEAEYHYSLREWKAEAPLAHQSTDELLIANTPDCTNDNTAKE